MRGQVQHTKNKELPIKKQDKPQKPKETMKRKTKQNSRKTLKTNLKLCGIMKTNHKPL